MMPPCTLSFALLCLASGVFCHPLDLALPTRDAVPNAGFNITPNLHYNTTTCSSNSYTLKANDNGTWPYREYKTINATSPIFQVEKNGKALAEGLIFLTLTNSGLYGYAGLKQQGAVIMTPEGDLVWSGPEGDTSNFRTQTFQNKTVLTTWTGHGSATANGAAAYGSGIVTIYDSTYNILHTVCPSAASLNISYADDPSTCVADVHESEITERDTILVTVYNVSEADLTSIGGPAHGYIRNPLAVEIDIQSNDMLWAWNPQDHVPFNASHSPLGQSGTNSTSPWDWFHINSIQSFEDNYLINSRGTWSSYFVNRSGDVQWELNGKTGGDFGEMPKGYEFSWQHHARLHLYNGSPSGDEKKVLYTNFNDANASPTTNNTSNGISLILKTGTTKSVSPHTPLKDVNSSSTVIAYAEGSHIILRNGNHFLGYGVVPIMQEFGREGDLWYSAQFAYNNHNNTGSSYRAFKEVWHATPEEKDLVLVVESAAENDVLNSCAGGSSLRGYVSWNGATDVDGYVIYTGSDEGDLQRSGLKIEKMGFETEFVVEGVEERKHFVQIGAWIGEREVGRSNFVNL